MVVIMRAARLALGSTRPSLPPYLRVTSESPSESFESGSTESESPESESPESEPPVSESRSLQVTALGLGPVLVETRAWGTPGDGGKYVYERRLGGANSWLIGGDQVRGSRERERD